TLLALIVGIDVPAALQTNSLPSFKRLNTVKPFWKASAFSLMISAGSAANGLVSIALTKIDDGLLSIAGILLNGRVRNAVHKPDSTKFCFTCSTVKFANCSMLYFAKVIWLSPSNLITTDCKT